MEKCPVPEELRETLCEQCEREICIEDEEKYDKLLKAA